MKVDSMLLFLSFLMLAFFCCETENNYGADTEFLISKLEQAEKERDSTGISKLFDEEASVLIPDGMPIVGKEAILSMYDYLWAQGRTSTVAYAVDSVFKVKDHIVEIGRNISQNHNNTFDTIPFECTFVQKEAGYQIYQLSFAGTKALEEYLKLPEPTGPFKVGQKTYFYDKEESGLTRNIAFQIWYPAEPENTQKTKYQTREIAKAAAKFLGWPLFFNSYSTKVETNSYPNAIAVKDHKLPFLLYNHGYGGFTSVYQTVFEDLASHGYIVVSIGHENESALMIMDDNQVLETDRENEFYQSRATELNGADFNALQNIILHSDDLEENMLAYQKLIKLSPLHNESTRLWAEDTRQVIGKLKGLNQEDILLKGSFNFDKIGIFGHSIGGAVAGQMTFGNDQIRAGINLDGFQFGDLIDNSLKVPFMFVCSKPDDNNYLRANYFMDRSKSSVFTAVISGFEHSSFTDLSFFQEGGKEAIQLQRRLILSFFDRYIQQKNLSILQLEEEFDQLKIEKHEN